MKDGTAPGEGPAHGGDLTTAARRFGRAEGDWLDLSTGINPVPYPVTEMAPESWTRLPQAGALALLNQAAAEAYGAANADMVAAAPGTQALIQILPALLGARNVAILGPTYAEHAACWRAAGARLETVDGLPAPDRTLVVVNPNNPNGRSTPPGTLRDWARRAAPGGHFLIADEAFTDVRPDLSLVPEGLPENAVVLRSFGKFFGLAGLRLGFALAAPELARRIEATLGPWAVSGPAIEIGAKALADVAWAAAARARLAADAARLRTCLTEHLSAGGGAVIGGTDLFLLLDHPAAPQLCQHLGRAGILVRAFDFDPRLLRFGLPGGPAAWERLERALADFGRGAA